MRETCKMFCPNLFRNLTVGLLLCTIMPDFTLALKQAAVGEFFFYKIEPEHFNWTSQVISEQFRYRPSLEGYPDLPSWMRYMYSHEYHAGYLYGTPPDSLAGKTIRLDIIALNKQNYETRQMVLSMFVAHKFPTTNIIQMKIDNLNWVHLMDPGRVENLRNIFRKDLWPESDNDLSLVFMESAVNMGNRLPLQPQQREGVIVHLGSFARFSSRLKELQEEVRPLYRLRRVQGTCPYKRTSAQKIFENAGFKLDWCAFKMVGAEISPEILFHNHGSKNVLSSEAGNLKRNDRWQSISLDDIPSRNYIDEFAFAFAIPGVLFAIFLGLLSVVLCFEHEKLHDPHSEFFFQNIFHICEEYWEERYHVSNVDDDDVDNNDIEDDLDENNIEESSNPHNTSTVHMVQYSDDGNNQPVTTSTLKSLKEPSNLLDNSSVRSQSPTSNLYPIENPSNAYMRPKPPPYKGSTLPRNGLENI